MLRDLFRLIYPDYCYMCKDRLHAQQKYFCYKCEFLVPLYESSDPLNTIVHERMFNKLQLCQAFSYFVYQKSNSVQDLIHDFKYSGIKDIGRHYGHALGTKILRNLVIRPDVIIPVPLHRGKLKARGYNQSHIVATALGEILELPVLSEGITKVRQSTTQTKLSRVERWLNTKDVFEIKHNLKQKHILMVDDVFTTGSTLEALGKACLSADCGEISVATLGIAV